MAKPSAFWDSWYASGNPSGEGSVGALGAWKWSIIDEIAGELDSVVDVACGDLSFWGERDCPDYVGIDISSIVLERNRVARPHWRFVQADASVLQPGISGRVVFCFDVLFHIMDDDVFVAILENLTRYSEDLIFVRSWDWNPFNGWRVRKNLLRGKRFRLLFKSLLGRMRTDEVYQTYRDFGDYIPFFEQKGFELVARRKAPEKADGSMFVFRKARI